MLPIVKLASHENATYTGSNFSSNDSHVWSVSTCIREEYHEHYCMVYQVYV